MRTTLTGRNIPVSSGLRQLVNRHLAKLERRVGTAIVSAQVVVSGERHINITDITLHLRGDRVLSGVGEATTWPLSVKGAVERLSQQVDTVKGKWTTRKRRSEGRRALVPAEPTPAVTEDVALPGPRVYRSKAALRALTIDDAAERLVKGTEAFLVFRNADTGRVAVVHRRADGHVALTEPDR